jgi:hypothetical protein
MFLGILMYKASRIEMESSGIEKFSLELVGSH